MDSSKEIKKCKCGNEIVFKSICLCRKCYQKHYRTTPQGKNQVIKSNERGKQKAKQKRLFNKQNKPPKEIKNCECGNIVKVKGFCLNCYQREYQREKQRQKRKDNPIPILKRGRPKKNSLNKKEIETSIKIDLKNKGHYFHKARLGQSKCKQIAMRDITNECGIDRFYTINYLGIENKVLSLNIFDYEIKDIDLINTKKY